jgi:ABC-type dipeptide/oligopeptide/nickel transport system permease component
MAVSKIRKIPPVPIALAVGLVNAVLGLILGILSAVNLNVINQWLVEWAGIAGVTIPQLSMLNAGALLIIGYPIGGFVVGFLGTLIVAHVYNVVAKKAPIHLELK